MTAADPRVALLVGADDRTGALEVAGELAARSGAPVAVVVGGATSAPAFESAGGTVVVDLAGRHRPPGEAAVAAAALDRLPAGRHAHKIDSLLRGNWAAELAARAVSRPVVLVPALPALGRVCVGGMVVQRDAGREHAAAGRDRPVHEVFAGDARGSPASSRPADLLAAAGASAVIELADAAALTWWLGDAGAGSVAVLDAATTADLVAVGAALTDRPDVLVAGPAAAVATVTTPFGATTPFCVTTTPFCTERAARTGPPLSAERVLVVCGSLHPTARAQLERLRVARPAVEVLASPDAAGPVSAGAAERAARDLAERAADAVNAGRPDVLIVIGGDTAASVLGDAPVLVEGLLAPGTPSGRWADGTGPTLVTRAGSFGDDTALVALIDLLSEC